MKIFAVRPSAGLGNRLLAFLSASRLARKHKFDLYVDWTADKHCNAEWHDVFQSKINGIRKRDMPDSTKFVDCITTTVKDENGRLTHSTPDMPVIDCRSVDSSVYISSTKIISEPGDFREGASLVYAEWVKEVGAEFKNLVVSEKVQSRVNEVKLRFDRKGYIGLHIRRPYTFGSFVSEEKFSFPANDTYAKAVDVLLQLSPDRLIYLATNCKETEDWFFARFGDGVITMNARISENAVGPEAIIDALADMMLLSEADFIIKTASSTFAYISGIIGGVPQILIDQTSEKQIPKVEVWSYVKADYEQLRVKLDNAVIG